MTLARAYNITLEQCFSLAWDENDDLIIEYEEQMTVALYYMEVYQGADRRNQHQGTYRFTESGDAHRLFHKMRLAFTLMHDIELVSVMLSRGRARLEKNVPFGLGDAMVVLVNVNALVGMPSKEDGEAATGISKTKERLIMDAKARGILDNGVWYSQATKLYGPRYVPLYTIPQCITNVMGWLNDFEMPWTLEGVEYRGTVDRETGHTYVEGKVFTGDQRLESQRQFVKPWSFEKLYTLCVNNVIVEPNQYLAQINELLAGFYFFV
ncbi:hypothetical protein SPFM12_00043 [Salmonella phage SPFM12]|nr:hypothetical protein SPFM12_00043 [Salmonella phage SPFM12]